MTIAHRKGALIVVQEFPTFSCVDMIRMTKFVRHLPEFGWHSIVWTARSSESILNSRDTEIPAKCPNGRWARLVQTNKSRRKM